MKMDTGDELYRIGDKLYHVQAGEMIIDSINETEISVTIKLGNRKGYTFPLREFGKKIFFSKEHARKRDSFIHCPDDYFIFAEVERRLEREKATKEREEERIAREEEQIAREEEQIAREEAAAIADVQSYLYEHFHENNRPFQVDQEQANAIARKEKDILVAARAGSGKTRVIVGKTLYCLEKINVPGNAICILSFNKDVQEEIFKRIQSVKPAPKNIEQLTVPQTFHRYAMRLAGIEGGILADDEIEERTRLISRIIKSLSEEDALFSEQIYKFFRKENAEIKEEFFHGNVKSYYSYIRNQHYQTLRGEYVRSKGEKWLADFFFEHGINYKYEWSFYPSKIKPEMLVGDGIDTNGYINFLDENKNDKGKRKAIRPDFYLQEHEVVWEHWGIDENKTNATEKENFGRKFKLSWNKYCEIMQWKQKFWNGHHSFRRNLQTDDNNVKKIAAIQRMLETSITDMEQGRENFELRVEEKLIGAGITICRRPMDEIIREVFEKHNGITRFSKQIRSFIDKYQQRYFDDECGFVTQMNKTHIKNDPRTHAFLSMGLKVLKRHEEILKAAVKPKGYESWADYRFDFNQVLFEAIKKIKAGGCSDSLKPLQYILVDEYQDFSKLFFEFIQAIREQNNNIQLFCVGDNWQAINRFAGSDTVYFENFKGKFPSGIRVDMSTNYRSGREIIEKSNNFMRVIDNDALPAKPRSDPPPPKSLIVTIDVSDMWIEQRPGQEYAKERAADKKYIDLFYYQQGKNNKDHDYPIKAQYMKKCVEIIKENPGKSVLILHRKNSFKISIELSEFKEKLHKVLKDKGICPEKPHEQIKVMTLHKSKGLEADVVVILEANQYVIPNIHPDNVLYSVFGETPTVTLTDERRLFYVAVTRAKEKCYILYEQERKSDFIAEYSWETIEANNYIEDVDDTALPF